MNDRHFGCIFYLLRLWVNKLYIYRNAIVSYAWLKYNKSYIHKLTLTNASHEGIFYLLRLWVNKLYIYWNDIVSYAWVKYDKNYVHKLTVTNASPKGSVWVTETTHFRGHDASKFVASIYPRWRVHDMQKVMHDRWPILSGMNWAVWIKRWGLLKQHEPMATLKGTFNSWTQPVKHCTWEGNPILYCARRVPARDCFEQR